MADPAQDPVTVEWVELEQPARPEDLAVAERLLAGLPVRFLATQATGSPGKAKPGRRVEPT